MACNTAKILVTVLSLVNKTNKLSWVPYTYTASLDFDLGWLFDCEAPSPIKLGRLPSLSCSIYFYFIYVLFFLRLKDNENKYNCIIKLLAIATRFCKSLTAVSWNLSTAIHSSLRGNIHRVLTPQVVLLVIKFVIKWLVCSWSIFFCWSSAWLALKPIPFALIQEPDDDSKDPLFLNVDLNNFKGRLRPHWEVTARHDQEYVQRQKHKQPFVTETKVWLLKLFSD